VGTATAAQISKSRNCKWRVAALLAVNAERDCFGPNGIWKRKGGLLGTWASGQRRWQHGSVVLLRARVSTGRRYALKINIFSILIYNSFNFYKV
jgi:hypothetical protein